MKSLAIILFLVATSCSSLINQRVIDKEYSAKQREMAADIRVAIPLALSVRTDCNSPKIVAPVQRKWLGWRHGWQSVPTEASLICVTPAEYKKIFPENAPECHP